MSEQFPEYPKINSLWKRHKEGPDKGKVITDQFAQAEYGYLADLDWRWTEKVDGTNIRLGWYPDDAGPCTWAGASGGGHDVGRTNTPIGGRTDNAQFNGNLLSRLVDITNNLPWWDVFGREKHVVLYGEGYGAGIQKVAGLDKDPDFVLFDVLVDGTWLDRYDTIEVAARLDLPVVPLIYTGPIDVATRLVRHATFDSAFGAERPEGLVGTPIVPLRDRYGKRIQTKIKWADVGPKGA